MRIYTKLITARRKDKLKRIEGKYTQKQWQTLCAFFDSCPRCQRRVDKFSKDHIIPITWKAGTNHITNIQPLCLRCNITKSNHSRKDYRPEHVKEWAENEG
jgi:5-methylcytosine-specific restriction endonuclease McrA